MSDIAALKAALDEAQAAHDALVEERRSNRESFTRAEFRAYNDQTRAQQVQVERAVVEAREALAMALNDVRAEALNVAVGTLEEKETAGGTS